MDQLCPVPSAELKGFRWALALIATLALMLAGCSSQNFAPAPVPATDYHAPSQQSYGTSRTEVASWYGPGFVGHRTSSGETFNPDGLTAASKTLPLGSHVRVANPDTGRSVVVRINDRGPFVRGRSLDLSHRAAAQIGLTGRGVGRVQVTPTATSTPAESSPYAESSIAANSRNLSYISYPTRHAYTRPTRHRYRSYHSYSSRRIVSNPIGSWLANAFPRF